jgi:hypothetical protein
MPKCLRQCLGVQMSDSASGDLGWRGLCRSVVEDPDMSLTDGEGMFRAMCVHQAVSDSASADTKPSP